MTGSVNASLIIGLLLAYLIKRYLVSAKKPAPYPPGPKGLPLLGNALDFPSQNIAEEYARWGEKYGSRFRLSPSNQQQNSPVLTHVGNILYGGAFGTHVIILNRRKDADELFERRASIYSDRPYYPISKM